MNLSQPEFKSLRKFIVHELDMAMSDYVQAFFKHDEYENSREQLARGLLRARQAAVETGSSANNWPYFHAESKSVTFGKTDYLRARSDQVKPLPLCFLFSCPDSKHFLMNCDKFKTLSLKKKKKA